MDFSIKDYQLENKTSYKFYQRWLLKNEVKKDEVRELPYKPIFSLIVPVINTSKQYFNDCMKSILDQTYTNYEVILIFNSFLDLDLKRFLNSFSNNLKIQMLLICDDCQECDLVNRGILASRGDFLSFVGTNDLLDPMALYEFATVLNSRPDLNFIYSDEDRFLTIDKKRHSPFFKPDWSPELLRSVFYTGHLGLYRTSLAKKIGGVRSIYGKLYEYDFALRFLNSYDYSKNAHIAKILYHTRSGEKKESQNLLPIEKRLKEDFIKEKQLSGFVEEVADFPHCRIVYENKKSPLVSIIIPSKDHPEVLKQAINSIYEHTVYEPFEIIVVDNGSSTNCKIELENFFEGKNIKYIYDKYQFNFSKMCNIGAKQSSGELLLFFNDDVEVLQKSWLTRLVGQASLDYAGAVGAKLYYPNSKKIQHTGVSIVKGPTHAFSLLDDFTNLYYCFNKVNLNYIAVTGACLIVSKEKFEQVDGFDENLAVTFNDVDLCIKLYRAGYYNIVRNDVIGYHHESLSRGNDNLDRKKYKKLQDSLKYLYKKHPVYNEQDPFLNRNLYRYCDELIYNSYKDCFEVLTSIIAKEIKTARLESVLMTLQMKFSGWGVLENKKSSSFYERFFIIKDEENYYKLTLKNVFRIDIDKLFHADGRFVNSGFEAVLPISFFKKPLEQYKFGLLFIDHGGQQYITWFKNNEYSVKDRIFFSKIIDIVCKVYRKRKKLLNFLWLKFRERYNKKFF